MQSKSSQRQRFLAGLFLSLLVVALSVVSVGSTETARAATIRVLNVPYVNQVTAQQQPDHGYWNLCGPSSAAMVSGYWGVSSNPLLDARNVFPGELFNSDHATDWSKMSSALSRRGLSNYVTAQSRPLSFDQIVAQIDAGRPIIFGAWYVTKAFPGGAAHIGVITGYDTANQTVIVHDPFGSYGWWGDPLTIGRGKYNGINRDMGVNQGEPYSDFRAHVGNMMVFTVNPPASNTTITVNDEDSSFHRFGPGQYWHRSGNGQNGGSYWTNNSRNWVGLNWNDVAEWVPVIPQTANYEVSVFIPDYTTAGQVYYEVYDCSGSVKFAYVVQSDHKGQWVTLGTYCMPKGQAQGSLAKVPGKIILSDVSNAPNLTQKVVWDTMKFVRR